MNSPNIELSKGGIIGKDAKQANYAKKRGPPPISQIRLYWLLKREPWLTLREAARRLGISYNAAKLASSRLKRNGVMVSKYCPACIKPSVIREDGQYVCTQCGLVIYEEVATRPSVKALERSAQASLIQVDKGLGLSHEMENWLIQRLKLKHLTMGKNLSLNTFGDPAFTRAVLRKIVELGNFRDGDFQISQEAARLARKLCQQIIMQRAEITRKTIKRVALKVLAELYRTYGHGRVRLSSEVMDKMIKEGLLGDG